MMERAGRKNSNVKKRQFWQQHNKPIELWSIDVIQQKLDYIHYNPVESGFVLEPHHWNRVYELTEGNYSSASNFTDGNGVIKIDEL
ncbi:MAG: hypothetical protein JEZ09_01445 [Salinivirgaceae bacterium]|nr:hypothetical protein [Salinivirgaceae bacterium]